MRAHCFQAEAIEFCLDVGAAPDTLEFVGILRITIAA